MTQRCWWGCKSHGRDIWREDSKNRRATDAYRCLYNCTAHRRGKNWYAAFLVLNFIITSLVVCCYNNESQIRRYNAFAIVYNCRIYRCEKYLYVIFSVLYFIGTALLVITHIKKTQKWASGSDPTLLFERRTERRLVFK